MNDHTLDGPFPAEWRVGDQISQQYEITGVHRGGMGVVYRARHLAWDVDVAVKRPRPFRTDADRDRFVREARTWVDLGLHPHVCNCHYVRTIDGVPAVVAEYVTGGSLADRIRDGGLYAGSDAEGYARILDIAVQAAWGLAHAHALGVVHRDVKPANILVGADVKVTDFGLAGAAAGSYRGTRLYASPEQAAGDVVGAAGDVWSFAVTVLEMVTREVTWLAGPAAGSALAGLDVPRELAGLLASCLEWDPANRPSGMAEVAAALVSLHTSSVGPYLRQPPVSAVPRADELNNRALSVLDLGHDLEARQLLDEALAADPRHPEATYNSGLLRWRAGETTDDAVLTDLGATDPSRAFRLISLVHAERGEAAPDWTMSGGGRARALGVTPDGEFVLVGDAAGAVRVVRVATGECVRVLAGHREEVAVIAVSSDGRQAVTASKDWTARLWDLATGRLLAHKAAAGRMRDAFHLEVAADGGFVMTTRLFEDQTTVRVWRLGSLFRARKLSARSGVSSLHTTSDGRHAFVAEKTGPVRAWDLTTGASLFSLNGHTAGVTKIETGGQHVLTAVEGLIGSNDHTARVWDLTTGQCLHVLTGHTAPLGSISVTPDGLLALTGSGDHTARLWDLTTGTCLRVFTGHTDIVHSVTLPGNAPVLAVTTELHGVVRVWEIATGRCLRTITEDVAFEDNVLLTPDERSLVHSGHDRVRLWHLHPTVPSPFQHARSRAADELLTVSAKVDDLLTRAEHEPEQAHDLVRRARDLPGHERSRQVMDAWRRLPASRREFRTAWPGEPLVGTGKLTDVCTTADGHVLSVGHEDNAVWVWDFPSRNGIATLTGHTTKVRSVCASGPYVAAGAADGTTRVWRDGEPAHTLQGHRGPVRSVCATPDGRLVTGGNDMTARVWDLSTGQCLHILKGHTSEIAAVLSTSDGRCITVGQRDQSVREWDLETGRFTRFLETYLTQTLYSASLTPDGHLLTVGFPSRQGVRVRELKELKFVRALGRDTSTSMRHVRTSPDGSIALVIESADAIGVWEVATGRFHGHLEGAEHGTGAVCFTPDGNHVLVGGDDGRIRVWDVDWDIV